MDVRRLDGKVVVVTGASSGMGRALAGLVAGRGASVALCDLDGEGLAVTAETLRQAGARVLCETLDVADAAAMEQFAAKVCHDLGVPELLVNNAGVSMNATFMDTSLEDWDWILGINLKGVVHGCHFFVPGMAARGTGHVVNIASMTSFAPMQMMNAYSTSKCAVLGFSLALRQELAPSGVGVTAVCPGMINTAIAETGARRGWQKLEEVAKRGSQAFRWRDYSPERAARGILEAVQRDRAVGPVAPESWLLYYMSRFVPGLFPVLDGQLARAARLQARMAAAGRGRGGSDSAVPDGVDVGS